MGTASATHLFRLPRSYDSQSADHEVLVGKVNVGALWEHVFVWWPLVNVKLVFLTRANNTTIPYSQHQLRGVM